MSDLSSRIQALPPEKRAVLERALRARRAGPVAAGERPSYDPPQTPEQEVLARVWEQVLGVTEVGRRDDFLALGGDSIQCVQVVARARQAGLDLTNQLVFDHPTLDDLAANTKPLPAFREPQEPAAGEVALTPIQRWFFELGLADESHWNQAVLLEASLADDSEVLAYALDAVAAHHDSFRLRFSRGPDGSVRQRYAEPQPVAFEEIDLRDVNRAGQDKALKEQSARLQGGLDLEYGPMFRIALFRLGAERTDQILIVAHHLIVDATSFRILLEDLQLALDQARAGKEIRLPLKTASYQKWAEALSARAGIPELLALAGCWASNGPTAPLRMDHPDGANDERSAAIATIEVAPEVTDRLLRRARTGGSSLQPLLLGALHAALRPLAGDDQLFELESHGRDVPLEGVDVSRTTGWFTALYPLRVRSSGDPHAAAAAVAEALDETPGHPADFGCLRYLGRQGSDADRLGWLRPQVLFNYLGRFDALEEGTLFRLVDEAPPPLFDPNARRPHVLQILGGVFAHALRFRCIYSAGQYRRETIEEVMRGFEGNLVALAEAAQVSADPGFTPQDLRRIQALAGGAE